MTTWAEIGEGDVVYGKDNQRWSVEKITRGKEVKASIRRLKDGREHVFAPNLTAEVVRVSEGAPKIKGADPHDVAVAVVEAVMPGSEVLSTVGPGDQGIPRVPLTFRTPSAFLAHLYAFHGIKDPKLGDPRHTHPGGEGSHPHTHED